LDPKWSGGRPRKFGPAARDIICQTARSTPSALGQPFTTWSLAKLADYLAAHHRLPVSVETIRRVLREADIRWQATKTWKASRDPDFATKMARIPSPPCTSRSPPAPEHASPGSASATAAPTPCCSRC
jgi:transposase